MDRRVFLLTSLAWALAAPFAAEAQQAAKIVRIGYLAGAVGNKPNHDAFLQGLRDLGYVEGRNVVVEYRGAEGEYERLPALAAELIALKVDVVVAPATAFALAAKQATSTIPIVFVSLDAVISGLVTSLARPGGNLTGLSGLLPDLVGKCLEHLTQVVPRVSRVAVLWQPGAYPERTEKELLTAARGAGQALGVRLQFVEARSPADFDRAFSEMTKARVGALTVLPSALLIRERKRLVDLAAKHRLPAVCSVTEFVRDAGGLMVYGPNVPDLHRRAAAYVDKILKGAQPGDLHQELSASLVDKILKGARPATLPVAQPTKFDLLINLKTAKALGLTIPPSLLARADQIIE